MSLEQARGEELDNRTDLFSFGDLLYEMVAGRQAFRGGTAAVIFDAILNRSPVPASSIRSDLPSGLTGAIEKSLQKDNVPGAKNSLFRRFKKVYSVATS